MHILLHQKGFKNRNQNRRCIRQYFIRFIRTDSHAIHGALCLGRSASNAAFQECLLSKGLALSNLSERLSVRPQKFDDARFDNEQVVSLITCFENQFTRLKLNFLKITHGI